MAAKRIQYSVKDKLLIVDEIKFSGKSINQISREKNVSRRCIKRWLNEETKMRECNNKLKIHKVYYTSIYTVPHV